MKTAARLMLVALSLSLPAASYAAPSHHDSPSDKTQKKFMKQKRKDEKKMKKAQRKSVKAWKKRNHAAR